MGAIWRGYKRYNVEFESDNFNRFMYNHETDDYGSYWHDAGDAGSIKSAKSIISKAKKEYAADNPRKFRIYDRYQDDEKGMALIIYEEN